jgi:two-component system chemotaxis response regulator CheY
MRGDFVIGEDFAAGSGWRSFMANKKVLVVDDSPTIRQQVSMCLTSGGYDVVEAQDGVEALTRTAGVSMCICDVNMPRMNGVEFVEKMGGGSIPIVMLTTEGRPELIERAKKAGAKGWMVKPFKPEHLLSVVKKLVG